MSRFTRPPFFIVGCVRSGTTMLRQILECQPALVCPEETHLFRWPYPFGTDDFRNLSTRNRTLRRHREIDGIGEDAFGRMLDGALTRRELVERYVEAYAARRKPEASRWFEKSPQNVYGIQLIQALFPEARFLHIVRHPLDVVSSLKLGKVMRVPDIVGAANYWLEAVAAIRCFGRANPGAVWEVRYEAFTAAPRPHLEALFRFLDEPFDAGATADFTVAAASHRADRILTGAEIAAAWAICGRLAAEFGYERWPEEAAAADCPGWTAPPEAAGPRQVPGRSAAAVTQVADAANAS
jgi:hypothetical protein